MGQCPCMSGRTTRAKPHVAAAVPPPPPPPALPRGGGPSFSRALWRMTSADVSQGNDVTLFSEGAATFDAMIELIDNARESVALESYILKADTVGRRFADALTRAAKRGVHAQLLADWFGKRGIGRSYLRDLQSHGVQVRVFNPFG